MSKEIEKEKRINDTAELIAEYHSPDTSEKRKRAIVSEIIMINEPLIHSTINNHWPTYMRNHFDDLAQECRIAMFSQIPRFDPSLGYTFSTFIVPYLLDACKGYISKMNGISTYYNEQYKRLLKKKEELIDRGIDNPSVEELAYEMDCGVDAVQHLLEITLSTTPISIEGDEMVGKLSKAEDTPEQAVEKRELSDIIEAELDKLPPNEKAVIEAMYFGSADGNRLTRAATAKITGFTQGEVKRLHDVALARLVNSDKLRRYAGGNQRRDVEDFKESLVINFVPSRASVGVSIDLAMDSVDDYDDDYGFCDDCDEIADDEE